MAFVVGLIVFLPFPSWQQLVGFITSATVLSFASGPLVLAALRAQIPDHERPFRVPGGHVIPFLAFWALEPDRLLVGLGHRLEAVRRRADRLRAARRSSTLTGSVPRQPLRLQGRRQLAAALAGRHSR